MSNLPKGWEEVKIGDFCDILDNQRIPISSEKRAEIKGNIPYYGANGVQDYINDFIFNETLVLLAEDGGNFNDYQTRPIAYMIHGKSWVNNHTHVLRAKNGENYFLFYSLVHKDITSFINGGTRTKLNRGELVKIPIFVPPLEEQKKIADILSTVDKKIAFVEENINATEELKKGLMQKLFTEGIGHTEFKDSELGRIPKSWEVVELLKVCEDNKRAIVDGPFGSNLKTIHFREEGIPVIQSNFVTSGKFNAKEYVYVDEDKFNSEIRSKVIGGDIVMAKIGANCGTSAIIPLEHPNALLSGNSIKISVDQNKASTVFIDFIFKSMYSRNKLVELKSVGAQPAISMPLLKKMKIVKPLLEEQKQIAEILSTVDNKLENLKEKKQSFEKLKKGLMQKLLTAEVRV